MEEGPSVLRDQFRTGNRLGTRIEKKVLERKGKTKQNKNEKQS